MSRSVHCDYCSQNLLKLNIQRQRSISNKNTKNFSRVYEIKYSWKRLLESLPLPLWFSSWCETFCSSFVYLLQLSQLQRAKTALFIPYLHSSTLKRIQIYCYCNFSLFIFYRTLCPIHTEDGRSICRNLIVKLIKKMSCFSLMYITTKCISSFLLSRPNVG